MKRFIAGLALALCCMGSGAAAENAAAFYKGKTVRLLVGVGPGGEYAAIAQLLSDHLSPHLSGRPAVVPQFMPGSGGRKMANYLYGAAPKDGTVIAMLNDFIPTGQLLQPEGARFNSAEFAAIGSFASGNNGVLAVMTDTGVRSLAATQQREVVLGSVGSGSATSLVPLALNRFHRTRFKVVTGYKGSADIYLAMERGEVAGVLFDYRAFLTAKPDWVRNGKIRWLVQLGEERLAELPDVPLLHEVTSDGTAREVLVFLSRSREMGKGVVAPGNVPAERLAALRAAFAGATKDPSLIEAARKRGITLAPRGWKKLQRILVETVNTPREIIELTKKVVASGG